MSAFELIAVGHAAVLGLFYLGSYLAAVAAFRRRPAEGKLRPMTLIRPLKGLDVGLEENLRAPLDGDPEGSLECLFAVESEDDPAYAIATRVAALSPSRARVVVTGPSGERMGKAHNMVSALRHATRDIVVFSDSDARADRETLVETSRAFDAGAHAVSGLPDASFARGAGDVLVCLSFNHGFDLLAALAAAAGVGVFFSGAWMAVRRDTLTNLGVLDRLGHQAADDFTLADALRRAKARVVLLPRLVPLYERGGTVLEAVRHLLKWSRIVRWTVPLPFVLLPLATPLPLVALACASAPADLRPAGLWCLFAALRVAAARLFDARCASSRYPWWGYAALPFLDIANVGLWLLSWPGGTIEWRGRRYRLRSGGRLTPLAT
ncbi:MAG: glycosyltransferase [Elusimicrobia bacterium]|nr:glycosyltransferase [Elusimicrobiota bacterium]